MRSLTQNLSNDQLILKVFSFLYAIAIFIQLSWDRVFILNNLPTNEMGLNPLWLFYFLCASLLINPFLPKSFSWIWLLSALLFFILINQFLYTQAGPEKAYRAWNHAIVFWTFIILGFQKTLGAPRTVFLLKFFLIFSYFAGRVAKIRHGFDWTNGWTLQYYFLQRHIDLNTPEGWWLVSDLTRAQLLSWLILLVELATPLVFINKRIEYCFVGFYFIFQILCWWLMKLKFMNYYGWSYLIYASILLVYLLKPTKKQQN